MMRCHFEYFESKLCGAVGTAESKLCGAIEIP
jgi:hypothetical protein